MQHGHPLSFTNPSLQVPCFLAALQHHAQHLELQIARCTARFDPWSHFLDSTGEVIHGTGDGCSIVRSCDDSLMRLRHQSAHSGRLYEGHTPVVQYIVADMVQGLAHLQALVVGRWHINENVSKERKLLLENVLFSQTFLGALLV